MAGMSRDKCGAAAVGGFLKVTVNFIRFVSRYFNEAFYLLVFDFNFSSVRFVPEVAKIAISSTKYD